MDKSSIKLASLAVLFLVFSFGTLPTTLGQCGYNNCTNFFRTCDPPAGACTCVPFGRATGSCIYKALIKQDLTYCLSHNECALKGVGNHCMKGGDSEFGWCLTRDESDGSIKLPA